MNATTLFETRNGGCYLYDIKENTLLHIHPVIKYLYQREFLSDTRDIQDIFPHLTPHEISYYEKKYSFFKEQGFFSSIVPKDTLSDKITANIVKEQVANVDNILFQVTGACNLQCRYCCYGEMYEESTNEKPMSWEMVKKVMDFMVTQWTSPLNFSHQNNIVIGFYGGEPLLNFPLIERIVSLCKELHQKHGLKFLYSMTTNALLLDKHLDFLAEQDFSLLISLDGNEKHDQLRLDKNGNPSFSTVFKNAHLLKEKYPEYFDRKVKFNSILNKHSSVEEIDQFMQQEFGKVPKVQTISEQSVDKKHKHIFDDLYRPYIEPEEFIKTRKAESPAYKQLSFFFYYLLNNSYKHYCEVIYGTHRKSQKIPTGTCLPFFKKMFITSDGKILVCERIPLEFVAGRVGENVEIDYEGIAEKYSQYFKSLIPQCNECFLMESCGECLFQLPFKNGLPVCDRQYGEKEFKLHLSKIWEILENNPSVFESVNKMIYT